MLDVITVPARAADFLRLQTGAVVLGAPRGFVRSTILFLLRIDKFDRAAVHFICPLLFLTNLLKLYR